MFKTLSVDFNPALAIKQAAASVLIAATLLTSSCALFNGGLALPSPAQVTSDTAGVVLATREVVLLAGPASEATLNAYILICHSFLAELATGIQAGTAVLPVPSVIQAKLVALAAQFGNPVWAVNMAGNLATEYSKWYPKLTADSAVLYAYVNAFAVGTV